jgi:hypothetical protein
LTRGRGRGYPVETFAATGVDDPEIIVVACRVGRCHRIWRRRRHNCSLELRDRELTRSRCKSEKDVGIQQTKDLGELRLAGDLALPTRDRDRELKLTIKLLVGPVEVDLDVLEHAELARANTRADNISPFAPNCTRAEAQLHVTHSLSRAASASP